MLLRVMLFSLIPVAASLIGGTISAFWYPSERLRSIVQHFAAGVVFAAAALELLPKVREQSPLVAIIGFAAGIVVMAALRATTEKLERTHKNNSNLGLIAATGVDLFIDGLVTGAGFTAGEGTGILLIIALVLEFFFLGISVSTAFGNQAPKWKIISLPTGLSLLTLVGAAIGVTVLGNVSAVVLAGVLAFGAVALMYLVTEELLVEAHQVGEGPWTAATYSLGFLIFLVIDELVTH